MTDAADDNKVQQLLARNAVLEAEKAALQHKVDMLLHRLYGKKAERREDNHPQLPFPGDEPEPPSPPHVDEAEDEEFDTITYTRKKRGATRISKDLPRERVVLELAEADRKCSCCGEAMQQIGEEVSERLDYTPSVVKVIETVRPKYACKQHEDAGVLTAEPPIHPIKKGMATAGLLSHVLVSKYKDHLPLYRQSRIFASPGHPTNVVHIAQRHEVGVDLLLALMSCPAATSVSQTPQARGKPLLGADHRKNKCF